MSTEYAARLREILAQQGHVIQHVFADDRTFGFTYTVGLIKDGQGRELLAINLPPQAAQSLLNTLAKRLAGLEQIPAEVSEVASVPLRLREVSTDTLGVPLSAFGLLDRPVPATVVQLLWPCAAGHWPGEPGYTHPCPQDPTNLALPPIH